MKVPQIDLARTWPDIEPEVLETLTGVLRTQHMILGHHVEAFEAALASRCAVAWAVGCASGTDALLLALMALEIGEGDEVITTPFTFFATAGAIVRAGARPVFVDVDPATFNIDASRIECEITERTRAILPVHLYGQPAEMDAVLTVAESHGLAVIEDAAQAIGATWHGRPAGGMGTLGCFSFYPTKNLAAAGDAGACVTDDESLAGELFSLRVHGSEPGRTYVHRRVGLNSRLDELQAVILNVRMKHLDAWNDERRRLAGAYDERLAKIDEVTVPTVASGCEHVYHQYVIRAERRDALRAHLDGVGIGARVFYPLPLHLQECFRSLGYARGDLPEAERASAEVLSLPMFPGLTDEEQDAVVGAIEGFYSA